MAESQNIDDQKRDNQRGQEVSAMSSRRETMADGRRYIVYYTFDEESSNTADMKMERATEDV